MPYILIQKKIVSSFTSSPESRSEWINFPTWCNVSRSWPAKQLSRRSVSCERFEKAVRAKAATPVRNRTGIRFQIFLVFIFISPCSLVSNPSLWKGIRFGPVRKIDNRYSVSLSCSSSAAIRARSASICSTFFRSHSRSVFGSSIHFVIVLLIFITCRWHPIHSSKKGSGQAH